MKTWISYCIKQPLRVKAWRTFQRKEGWIQTQKILQWLQKGIDKILIIYSEFSDNLAKENGEDENIGEERRENNNIEKNLERDKVTKEEPKDEED